MRSYLREINSYLGGGFNFFPQTGLPVGFYLRKKRLDTLVGSLCCADSGRVGRRFGSAWSGRAGLGWAWYVHLPQISTKL